MEQRGSGGRGREGGRWGLVVGCHAAAHGRCLSSRVDGDAVG